MAPTKENAGPSLATPDPCRPTPPPEQCFSSHHSFHSHTRSIRLQITDTTALIPTPCIPSSIASLPLRRYRRILQSHITEEQWREFATDANREIGEWKIQATRVQFVTRVLLVLCLVCGLGCVPLWVHFLSAAHDADDDANDDSMYLWRIGAIVLTSLSAICLLSAAIVVYRGAAMERSARSDLIAVLDWHTDETEDDSNVSFELVKCRQARTSDDDNNNGIDDDDADAPSSSPSWIPVYHYYIKIVVKSDATDEERGGGEEDEGVSSSFLFSDTSTDDEDDEEGEKERPRKEPSSAEAHERDDDEAGDDAAVAGTLQEPLLTLEERESAIGT